MPHALRARLSAAASAAEAGGARRDAGFDGCAQFVIALYEEFGVEIPETDYAKLTTLDGIVSYLASHVAERLIAGVTETRHLFPSDLEGSC
jgi:hypothetical protein